MKDGYDQKEYRKERDRETIFQRSLARQEDFSQIGKKGVGT
jgi:hypothetical protein